VIDSYLLHVRLTDSQDPTISRLLVVPTHYTFAKLHEVLQVAFGWAVEGKIIQLMLFKAVFSGIYYLPFLLQALETHRMNTCEH